MNFVKLLEKIKKTNNILILMVGVPLSGKSTFIKKIKDYAIIMSRDDLIIEIAKSLPSNKDIDISYNDAYNSVNQKQISVLFKEKLNEAGQTGNNYIIDMTNVRPKYRKDTLSYFPNHEKIAIVLDTPTKKELLRRNENRKINENKYIDEEVIDKMINRFTFPTKKEGFDYILKI